MEGSYYLSLQMGELRHGEVMSCPKFVGKLGFDPRPPGSGAPDHASPIDPGIRSHTLGCYGSSVPTAELTWPWSHQDDV